MIATVNPAIKMTAILIPGVLLSFSFDIFTPLVYLLFIITVTFLFSNISFKKWLLVFSPFIFLSVGFALMTILHTSDGFGEGALLFEFLWFEVTTGSVMVGISLALRSLCFVALSLLFVLTTDSTAFMLSLMQQFKLPPKLTYGILAGYRFLPTFKHEFEVLKQAHRIRGVGRAKGIKGRINQCRRYAIPLMANAIRKAERVAIAMESKGFTGSSHRTYYHHMTVGKKDWVFFGGIVGVFFLVIFISYSLGYLNIFGHQFG
ncbi:energy-coupling factor transporter transmembrane protein EcfT [Salipaludibacillus sp. LMS25]|uniref:energy-coupling factor transporter transmembrane component T family protein n=1 Tax=Salipaludibacillus sp. LMS25 TaxID=2924031 RepID=UPI0020D034DF|nr:energy-coupling factor transporter transmembrane component T [Salipaludibacillus sp. LMS25]UTR13694.1 energy-coupling factor transporter transmembrane protein EcfT [Salipaludibacillus sp. LMS25]